MKTLMVYLIVAAVVTTGAGCTQQALKSSTAKPDDILVSVTSPEQQQLWRDAIKAGTLPPISGVEMPSDPVTTIPVASIAKAEAAKAPTIPESVATTVLPVTLPDDAGFVGKARILELTNNRIRLQLDNGQPLDIAYRSPSRTALGGLGVNQIATVEIAPVEVLGPAQRYSVAIGGAGGGLALVALQESGDQLIARKYEIEAVSIRQLLNTAELRRLAENPKGIPPGGQPLPVEVSVGGKAIILSPGDIALPANTGLAYEIVVFDSRMYGSEAAWSDTPPFSLHIAIFAADVS